ncbi:hypothetical protein PDJAM_G00195930 [Pangasius djambal]|uniref:Uncharacterized protein n=1 Tax=Pangasius djambal TaxID=1691987 RepID=A0ACC5Y5V5_9TELE|nr:hypothetical protein [Pangasius djambal]
MCNDLLRRLSKSQNTVFCGRIQLFLARLFPLSEKSGLNLQSQFNLENITVFNKNEQESTLGQQSSEVKEDGMEEGEMGDEETPAPCSIPIDYNLYRKFWTLQDYFRNPVQCYDKFSWITFIKYSDETDELTRLWNLNPDNMEACKSDSREFMPSLEEFFEEAIEQADPANMVEDQYKVVRNSNYGWRALRLLSRRSPHFFQPTNQQFKSLEDYLENMVIKLAKELPKDLPSEEIKTGEEEDENGDNLLKESNDSPSIQSKLVTNSQMDEIAKKLGAQWKTLAPHLDVKEAEIREIEADSDDVELQAKMMLVSWQDREDAQATMESLVTALNAAGFASIAQGFGET